MADETNSGADTGGSVGAATGAQDTGTQAPAETMTPEQAAARIETLKADPAHRKMLLGQSNQIGTRSAREEWDKLHQLAHSKAAQRQAAAGPPDEYELRSPAVGRDHELLGWMRGLGADQGFVDGAIHLAEKLGNTMPTPEQVEEQGARAIEVLQRKYGESAAEKIDSARSLIRNLPTAERERFEAFLEVTGLGSHPWMVERLALLAERRAR